MPGTEGRKTKLRFDGHGSNLLFGGPSFFVTPNFADTYNPIVKLLHVRMAQSVQSAIDTIADASVLSY